MITREEWLRRAVEELNSKVFNGDLDILNHKYRITWGKTLGQKRTETVQPYMGEDVKLDDFFPTTISVSYQIGDTVELLGCLAYEMIRAFENLDKVNKRFKILCDKYLFDSPYTSAHPSAALNDILREVALKLEKENGKWEDVAGKPVFFHKEEKAKQKNNLTIFCPSCGMEFHVNKKKFEKAGSKLPVCGCGAHMGIACDEEDSNEQTTV